MESLRGMDGGTRTRSGTEQERPVCARLRQARDPRYKPMVKSEGAQRESDGVVVPLIGVQHNAPGGKGPDFGDADQVGKHAGMTGDSWSNYPDTSQRVVAVDGNPSPVRVRELQRRYGLRPSSLRIAVFMRCMTVSTEVTCCGRHGNGSGRTGERPGWIGSPWLSWRRSTELPGCWVNSSCLCGLVRIVRRLPGVWTSRNQ